MQQCRQSSLLKQHWLNRRYEKKEETVVPVCGLFWVCGQREMICSLSEVCFCYFSSFASGGFEMMEPNHVKMTPDDMPALINGSAIAQRAN